MDDDQQFCLRWNNHQSTLISVFDTLLENQTLVDCTLAAEGKFLKAHKVVLSACSPYFATLLQQQYDKHPIFILKDVKYQELRAMMDYMYRGEVNISQDQLAALLKAAESLQIKGLSDNRSSGGATAPKPEHHRASMPTGKLSSGYTLEQTKRARIAGPNEPEMGSREGSSSPSRRRRKVRRRSIENANTADVHENSNSSQQQQTQSNASGLGAITAAASALATVAPISVASLASNAPLSSSIASSTAVTAPGTTLSSSKKTDNVKGTTQQQQQQQDAMNTENVQGPASATNINASGGSLDAETTDTSSAIDKSNHKLQQQQHKQSKESINAAAAAAAAAAAVSTSELVIEPKAEYDDEANDEPVEDLTLDEEDMGMDDLDQNAGTSQGGGEGSSQGYAPWQHDRSQDELLLATQEAQQRDPQDLTQKLSQGHKENTAPNQVEKILNTNTRSILNTNNQKRSNSRNSLHSNETTATTTTTTNDAIRKRLSMSDVSDMLYEFYRANAAAKAPKSQAQQQSTVIMGSGATAAAVKYVGQSSPTSAETHEPSSIAAIATFGAASETASKNLQSDEMMPTKKLQGSFHPRLRVSNKLGTMEAANVSSSSLPALTAIPTSVVVASPSSNLTLAEPLDIKPIINPNTGLVITPLASVIKPVPVPETVTGPSSNPQAAAIAAALLRDGYHSFQQQIRAQEIIKFHADKMGKSRTKGEDSSATTKILETFLRQQRHSECDNDSVSDYNEGDDEDDSRYNGFDDIHLMEGSRGNLPQLIQNAMANNSQTTSAAATVDYPSDESQKFMSLAAQAQALRNLEYTLGEFGSTSPNDSSTMGPTGIGADGEPVYECRHCGKKYRWKSTLRRHENVECGGKEPSHACPYCPYKSKQRGNLGVHVRKHHSNLPQLASKRRSKYSMKFESNSSSANVSDDSNSKLIIDCSK